MMELQPPGLAAVSRCLQRLNLERCRMGNVGLMNVVMAFGQQQQTSSLEVINIAWLCCEFGSQEDKTHRGFCQRLKQTEE